MEKTLTVVMELNLVQVVQREKSHLLGRNLLKTVHSVSEKTRLISGPSMLSNLSIRSFPGKVFHSHLDKKVFNRKTSTSRGSID